jgi:hypothetical protein
MDLRGQLHAPGKVHPKRPWVWEVPPSSPYRLLKEQTHSVFHPEGRSKSFLLSVGVKSHTTVARTWPSRGISVLLLNSA